MPLAPETLLCRSVVPSRECVSSRDAGWTSLLLDLHTGATSHDAYTSIATPDLRIGVSISGRYACDVVVNSRWRHDAHDPGTVCLHRTGEPTRYRFPKPETSDYRLALIYLPFDLIEEGREHVRRAGRPARAPTLNSIVVRDPAVTHTAHALLGAMQSGTGDLYCEAAAAWLAMHVLTRHAENCGGDDVRSAGWIEDRRLARVLEFMAANFSKPLTIAQLADEACVSKFHFSRLFRARLDQTPHRYLTELRLDAARRMLLTTDLAVTEVGAACGFASPPHFSTAFSRRFGVSPSRARREHRIRGP